MSVNRDNNNHDKVIGNGKVIGKTFGVTADTYFGFIGSHECNLAEKDISEGKQKLKKKQTASITADDNQFVAGIRIAFIFKIRNQQSHGINYLSKTKRKENINNG